MYYILLMIVWNVWSPYIQISASCLSYFCSILLIHWQISNFICIFSPSFKLRLKRYDLSKKFTDKASNQICTLLKKDPQIFFLSFNAPAVFHWGGAAQKEKMFYYMILPVHTAFVQEAFAWTARHMEMTIIS